MTVTSPSPEGLVNPKLLVAHVGSDEGIFIADVLQTEGELWLVAEWLETQDRQWRTPRRTIRVTEWVHQRLAEGPVDLVLDPIPKAVLDGHADTDAGVQYVVLEGPSDRFGWLPVPRTNA